MSGQRDGDFYVMERAVLTKKLGDLLGKLPPEQGLAIAGGALVDLARRNNFTCDKLIEVIRKMWALS